MFKDIAAFDDAFGTDGLSVLFFEIFGNGQKTVNRGQRKRTKSGGLEYG
ncbi:MAG: hypothetical protein U0L03_06005 [Succinivibrionaceae bacterium]|nr:hypothetical protein [Succinivibrionaceae bacterium]